VSSATVSISGLQVQGHQADKAVNVLKLDNFIEIVQALSVTRLASGRKDLRNQLGIRVLAFNDGG